MVARRSFTRLRVGLARTRWRDPAEILDIDETCVAVKFLAQTLKAARYCARQQVKEKNAEEAEWNPIAGSTENHGNCAMGR